MEHLGHSSGGTCVGKRWYSTFAAANRVAKRMRRYEHDVLVAYRCRFCGRFHVGHPTTELFTPSKLKRRRLQESDLTQEVV